MAHLTIPPASHRAGAPHAPRLSRVLVITAKAALPLTRAAGMQFTAAPWRVPSSGCYRAGGDPRTGWGSFPPANTYSILDTC